MNYVLVDTKLPSHLTEEYEGRIILTVMTSETLHTVGADHATIPHVKVMYVPLSSDVG